MNFNRERILDTLVREIEMKEYSALCDSWNKRYDNGTITFKQLRDFYLDEKPSGSIVIDYNPYLSLTKPYLE